MACHFVRACSNNRAPGIITAIVRHDAELVQAIRFPLRVVQRSPQVQALLKEGLGSGEIAQMPFERT